VLPIVMYLKVGLEGIGVDVYRESIGSLTPLTFEYLYVGLPGLSAVEYVQGESWLGVALSALMSIPREQMVWLGTEALRRISQAPLDDQQRYLLGDCVEAYLDFNDEQRREYDRLIDSMNDREMLAMNKTTYDRGLEQGLEQGQILGARRTLLRAGRRKFHEPSQHVVQRIDQIADIDRLELLVERIFEAESWEELLGEE
jgi:hypothetical protein